MDKSTLYIAVGRAVVYYISDVFDKKYMTKIYMTKNMTKTCIKNMIP